MSLIGTGEKHYITLQGKILNNSVQVANARVIRKVRSNQHEDRITEEFNTDDLGNFSLPVREESYDLGLTQFVSATQVDVEVDG